MQSSTFKRIHQVAEHPLPESENSKEARLTPMQRKTSDAKQTAGEIVKDGMLNKRSLGKRSSVRNWRKRYFVLRKKRNYTGLEEYALEYYKTKAQGKKGVNPGGIIHFATVSKVQRDIDTHIMDKERKHCWAIDFTQDKQFNALIMQANSDAEKNEWADFATTALNHHLTTSTTTKETSTAPVTPIMHSLSQLVEDHVQEADDNIAEVPSQDISEEMLSRRAFIVKEILCSEQVYNEQLKYAEKQWLQPMQRDMGHKHIKKSDTHSIWGNFHSILTLSTNFLTELLREIKVDEILEYDNDRLDQICRTIADLFIKYKPFFMMYSMYINNFEGGTSTLARLRKNASCAAWLDGQSAEGGMNIESILIMPVQRPPRYRLLLEELLKHTSPSRDDYSIVKKSLRRIKATVELVNKGLSCKIPAKLSRSQAEMVVGARWSKKYEKFFIAKSNEGVIDRALLKEFAKKDNVVLSGDGLISKKIGMLVDALYKQLWKTGLNTSPKRSSPSKKSKASTNGKCTLLRSKEKDGCTLEYWSDGRKVQKNPDGSVIVKFPNGRKKQTNADGTKIEHEPNGVRTDTRIDGTIIKRYTDGSRQQINPDGTVINVLHDGSEVTTFTDGTTIIKKKDGSKQQTNPDGTTIEKFSDGSKIITFPNGATKHVFLNGKSVQYNPNGTKIEIFADKSRLQTFPNGCTILCRVDGSKLQVNPNGTKIETFASGMTVENRSDGVVVKRHPDGTKTLEDPDGSKLEVRSDGVTIHTTKEGVRTVKNSDSNTDVKSM